MDGNEFLKRLELQKQADKLLKDSFNTDESQIAHLLNNATNRHASGKLTEYQKLLATCKFKICVYWDKDKWGRQYTIQEKKEKKHRRYIPSVDKVANVINEELGFVTLIDYLLKRHDRLDSAQIILIDRINGLEHTILKYNVQNVMQSERVELEFETNKYGNRYFIKMLDEPLRTDKLRVYESKI